MGKLMRKVFFGQLRAAEFEVTYTLITTLNYIIQK